MGAQLYFTKYTGTVPVRYPKQALRANNPCARESVCVALFQLYRCDIPHIINYNNNNKITLQQ